MELLSADGRYPPRLVAIDHAYMLLYSRGTRVQFQRVQMPMLGVDVSLVTGYDREELTTAQRKCVFGEAMASRMASIAQNATLAARWTREGDMYHSQLIKLWSVFYDIVRAQRRWSLIMEDDAIVHPDRLPAVDAALRLLHAAGSDGCSRECVGAPPAMVHLSSFHPIGHDMVVCGLQPRQV